MWLPDIDWIVVLNHLTRLAFAYLLAVPIAWNREKSARSAGLRTFPLVATAACGYMLVGIQVLDSTDAESRVLYGLITGMGFIGGGAILKRGQAVSGTATAASLWTTGAIGMAVAYNRFEIAIALSTVTFLTLHFARRVKPVAAEDGEDGED